MTVTLEEIRALPKCDLHCHLDGSLRIGTVIELAREHGVKLPTYDEGELLREVRPRISCKSLQEYLRGFDILLSVLQEKEALERCAFELAEDSARDNVNYMEIRYAPTLHRERGLSYEEIIDAVLKGLERATEKYGIRTGLILSGVRHLSPDLSLELGHLAVKYKGRGIVGFDLAGEEGGFPAKHHKETFYLMKNNNMNITVHAGQDQGPESIAQALHVCGAWRLGNGTRLRESGELLNYVNDHRIAIEACLSSSLSTNSKLDGLAEHPVRFYYEYGLRVTLNTDSRLVCDTTMSKELMLAHEHLGFTLDDLKDIIVNGYKSAFLPLHEKQDLLMEVLPKLGLEVPRAYLQR